MVPYLHQQPCGSSATTTVLNRCWSIYLPSAIETIPWKADEIFCCSTESLNILFWLQIKAPLKLDRSNCFSGIKRISVRKFLPHNTVHVYKHTYTHYAIECTWCSLPLDPACNNIHCNCFCVVFPPRHPVSISVQYYIVSIKVVAVDKFTTIPIHKHNTNSL